MKLTADVRDKHQNRDHRGTDRDGRFSEVRCSVPFPASCYDFLVASR